MTIGMLDGHVVTLRKHDLASLDENDIWLPENVME